MAVAPEHLTIFSDGVLAIASGFIGTAQQAGLSLLGLFAVLDLVLFGIAVALGQRDMLAKGIWKLLLIGVVLLLVRDGGALVTTLSDSALYLSRGDRSLLPDPVALLAVGTQGSLDLMRLSADTGPQLLGASISLSGLAIAMIVTFGLAAGALLYQLAAFHLTAGIALVMLPIGLFSPGRALLGRAGRGLLTATVRLTTVLLICLPLPALLTAMMTPLTRQSSMDMPLAQLCLGLCLFVLLLGLPRAAMAVVGDFAGVNEATAAASPSSQAAVAAQQLPPRTSLQAAAAVPLGQASTVERFGGGASVARASDRFSTGLLSAGSSTTISSSSGNSGLRSSPGVTHSSSGLSSSSDARRPVLDRTAQTAPPTAVSIDRLVSDALRRSLAPEATTRGYRAIEAGTRTEDDKDPRDES
ncbi:type IV secretion system protein [Lacibacterium aquatile]|uniref:Type IV secretion system protein n=1 Tax=Lacibacterium aquatile TaxID=1168082 RepID=A0ABW5DUE7_9PROT